MTAQFNQRTRHRVLFAAILLCSALILAPQALAQPKISTPQPIYQFGSALNTEVVTNDFIIQNEGDAPLQILGIQTSCGCSAADPGTNRLEPGEQTTITANFDLANRSGPQTTSFTVRSNDPNTPALRLQFRGEAQAPINVEPRTVNFRQLMAGETHTESVELNTSVPELFFNVERIVNPVDGLEVAYETLESGKSYRLTFTVMEDAPEGAFNSNVVVHTGNAQYPVVNMRVAGQIMGDLVIVPNRLRIPYNESPGNTANQYIRVGPGRVTNFEVVDAVGPSEDIGIEISEQRGNSYLLRITDIPVDGRFDGADILIYTDIPGNTEFRVPISNENPNTED